MSGRSGLGRGLSSLIPAEPESESAGDHTEVAISHVVPNPRQPRRHFDPEGLDGLAASIRALGVLQPLLVRRTGPDRYELIAGERRLRAATQAGLEKVPVVVRPSEDEVELLEAALVENLQREDLNALEEAAAYRALVDDFSLTQEQVATRVGRSRATISNTLRLLQLPPEVQAMVVDGRLSAGHARAVLAAGPERQERLAAAAVDQGWSVRETEAAARAEDGAGPAGPGDRTSDHGDGSSGSARDPGVLELEEILSEHLSTRVRVSLGRGRGKVVVEFADLGDLERIYRLVVGS